MSTRETQQANLLGAISALDPTLCDVLELGVWKGATLRTLKTHTPSHFCNFLEGLPSSNPYILTPRRFYGFDTFEGLPDDWYDVGGELLVAKGNFDLGKKSPKIPGVEFLTGEFQDTLPQYLEDPAPIALLHIDSDLYSSAVTVLEALEPCIVKNTIIVFDEWIYKHDIRYDDCEKKAFLEWASKYNRKFKFLDFTGPLDYKGHVEQRTIRILDYPSFSMDFLNW